VTQEARGHRRGIDKTWPIRDERAAARKEQLLVRANFVGAELREIWETSRLARRERTRRASARGEDATKVKRREESSRGVTER